MDFFGYKKGRVLLVIAAIGLFAFVVWPFLRGGRTVIQTKFMPMNTQMQAMISPTVEESLEEKPLKKSDAKYGQAADSKPTNKTYAKYGQDTDSKPIPTNAISGVTIDATSKEGLSDGLSAEVPKGQLDLNTATLEQLDELPGIGESKARAILEYRIKKGRFSQIDELTEVKGIGEKMLEKLRVFLYVTPS